MRLVAANSTTSSHLLTLFDFKPFRQHGIYLPLATHRESTRGKSWAISWSIIFSAKKNEATDGQLLKSHNQPHGKSAKRSKWPRRIGEKLTLAHLIKTGIESQKNRLAYFTCICFQASNELRPITRKKRTQEISAADKQKPSSATNVDNLPPASRIPSQSFEPVPTEQACAEKLTAF